MKPIDLMEHPEGGRFKEVFRSPFSVTTSEGESRPALTHIYFSLNKDEKSGFHRVKSDEVWNLYRGTGLYLYIWDGGNGPPFQITLSIEENRFCYVVPAGCWQAAKPIDDKILVGCSVAPGFEFSDFEMMESGSDEAKLLFSFNSSFRNFVIS